MAYPTAVGGGGGTVPALRVWGGLGSMNLSPSLPRRAGKLVWSVKGGPQLSRQRETGPGGQLTFRKKQALQLGNSAKKGKKYQLPVDFP